MRDDIEFNIAFCELIEKYPALYNHNRADYCNRNVQDKLWQEIGKRFNETAKDCKDRWQNLRGRYGKFKKARSLPSGSEAKTVKDYYLAPYLHFLDDFIKSRKSKSNLNHDVESNQNLDDLDYEPETAYSPSTTQSSAELDPGVFPMPSPSPSPTGSVRTRTPTLKDINTSAYQYFTQKKNQQKTTSPLDSDLSFLQSVLPDMKLMTPDQKRTFKIGILNLAQRILKDNSPVDSDVHPSVTSFASPNQQASNQYESKEAPLASSGYENPGTSTQSAELIQHQSQTQYQFESPGRSTQPAELIQHQNQAQYALPASGHENPGTSTDQAQNASPAVEYQIPVQSYQSLQAYSQVSPPSVHSRLPYNDRTTVLSLDDY